MEVATEQIRLDAEHAGQAFRRSGTPAHIDLDKA
jgi:hypothetical protein